MTEQRKGNSCILLFFVARFRGCGDERERLLKCGFEEMGLTRQECRIALLILDGGGNGDICSELYITRNTLKFHIRNINRKLGIHGRRELVGIAMRMLPRPGGTPGGSGARGRIINLMETAAFYRQQCREKL